MYSKTSVTMKTIGQTRSTMAMREETARSVKLNREISKMLPEAIEKDRLIKIGYGSGGDTKPRDGDFGVVTHLPEKSRVLILGNLGECVGSMNRGGILNVEGSCSSMLGAFQSSGRIVVERDVGDRLAMNMKGGDIVVMGSAGMDACAGMVGGTVVIRGHASSGVGSGMKGGTLVVLGSVGEEPGISMTGGKIIIAGSCPPPGEGAKMRSISTEEVLEISEILEPLGLSVEDDALVLIPEETGATRSVPPKRWISEGFDKIAISPLGPERIAEHSKVDTSVRLPPVGSDEGGLFLEIPWVIKSDKGHSISSKNSLPKMVKTDPTDGDLLVIGENELMAFPDNISGISGIVLDLQMMPPMNDAEIEAILVSMSSQIDDNCLILVRDGVERVEGLFRLIVDLDLDGAVVGVATPGGSRASASLPRIGLSSRAMGFESQRRIVAIEITSQPTAEDMIVTRASGCSFIIGPLDEETGEEGIRSKVIPELVGLMKESGISSLGTVGRRALRAKDMDTAAISGLRLVGFERALPMWLGN